MEEPNSNEYLDMANHAKELVEKAEEKMYVYKKQNIELKKEILSIYGVVRILDQLIDVSDIPAEIILLSETLRGYISEYVDINIL
tara:strand:- start:326 stop:580 length:255 start_codon:yes stop_codon:yes gene_type:complete